MFDWIIRSKIVPHVVIILFAAAVTASVGWLVTDGRLEVERLGRANDKVRYENALQRAEINALNNARVKEAEYAAIKQTQDANYSRLLDKYRADVLRYKAAQSSAGSSNLSGSTSSAPVDARPGEDSLIPVTEADLLICAENTAKAQVAHEWALEIQKSK